MGKIVKIVLLAAIVFGVYTFFSDPGKREKLFKTVENSTGVKTDQLTGVLKELPENLTRGLGGIVNDPSFRRSVEKLSGSAVKKLKNLNKEQLERLKKDIEKAADKSSGINYDEILEKYTSENLNL